MYGSLAAAFLGAALLLLSWVSVEAAPAASGSDIGHSEQQLLAVRERIRQMQRDLKSSEARQQALAEELRAMERRIGKSAGRLRELSGQLQQQHALLSELQEKRRLQRLELERQRESLAQQLRSAYAMGRQERLKILLNQQDPAIVSRVMVYYDYLNRARTEQMAQINDVLDLLRRTALEITEEEQRLTALRASELDEQALLQQNRRLRQEVIVALGSDIRGKGEQLEALKENAQQLQRLIDKLQEELINLPLETAQREAFKNRKGRLNWPTKGRLKALFGTPKAGNLKWDGVLISAAEGREVKAVHNGRIAFADWLRGFGLLLIIDHGDGYMTLYGHNQSLFKETGEWVEAGESVSLVGDSGGQSNAGVYFGIRHKGKAVNPKRWCKKPKGRRVGRLLNVGQQPWSKISWTMHTVG